MGGGSGIVCAVLILINEEFGNGNTFEYRRQ